MVTILKIGTSDEQKKLLIHWFQEQGLNVNEYENDGQTVLGLIGDISRVDIEMLEQLG